MNKRHVSTLMLDRVRLGLEKRAAALSYFYSVRMDELETLAEHRTVETFFRKS